MNKQKAIGGVAFILLVVAAAWMLGLFGGSDPAIAELEQMREQMFDGRDLPEAQRQQLRDDFRQRLGSLSDDQRRAFFEGGRDQWMQHAEQRMDEFFAMAPADQNKQLDEMLNRMLQRRNGRPNTERQARGGERRGGRDGWRNMSESQRDERAKRRLDRTSPKVRAQFTEFRRRLNERAEKRGINPSDLPGRPGGGWGRG